MEQGNPQLKLAHDFVQYTGTSVFLTGKAGTGKTTFLQSICHTTFKRSIVTAPTGIAAINAGGVTLHSFFQLPFGPHLPETKHTDPPGQIRSGHAFSKEKANIIRSLDLLIIDEISMVRADLLDAVDEVLRRFKNKYKPFGGVQLLMIGDLQQLAPVVKEEDWNLLEAHYDTPFFFSSHALRKTAFVCIELKRIYRQSDPLFIDLLNKVRENKLDQKTLELLNKRCVPDFDPDKERGYITLTTHNHQAHSINTSRLKKIDEKGHRFTANVSGTFPEYAYPTELELELKPGAQVMFVRNDPSPEKRFFNGKIGTIRRIQNGVVFVSCPEKEDDIDVCAMEWNNYSYTLDEKTNEITETVIGTFQQIPLKLAWAITIHKSQGLTFDRAVIDANAAFAHGQVYVALSRCRSLDGLVLRSKIHPQSIKVDESVLDFSQEIEGSVPDEKQLSKSRRAFEHTILSELNDFSGIRRRIDYCLRILSENVGILQGKPYEVCKKAAETFTTDLLDVSRKFTTHLDALLLHNPDAQNNPHLNERLSKACNYYHEKMVALFDGFFQHLIIETDNKALKKSLKDAVERLSNEVTVKKACLEATKTGFSVTAYLDARAKASIENKTSHQPTKPQSEVSGDIPHPELYLTLKKWRTKKANDLHVPVYMILSQKTIADLCALLPVSTQALKSIRGLGDSKIQKHGVEILDMLIAYCRKNRLKTDKLGF